ncbi:hypothetical protein [Deinococcus misasensis]|uniref:hypothetical protein n=1 Tax=Deinococcus misasensis TaxID=392413 RepID=UPI00054DE05E|nr:hypothetical protein [Deinococcus misasensis]
MKGRILDRRIVIPQHLVNTMPMLQSPEQKFQHVTMVYKSLAVPDSLYVQETGGIMPAFIGGDGFGDHSYNQTLCKCKNCGTLFSAWADFYNSPNEDTPNVVTDLCCSCDAILYPSCDNCGEMSWLCTCDGEIECQL